MYLHAVTKSFCSMPQVFFFKAQLKAGEVELSNDAVESHVWLRRADIAQYADHAYTQEVNKFVLDL